MQTDEQAIRTLIADWQKASATGDIAKLKTLMAEDVVFLTLGQPPMRGRDAFVAAFENVLKQMRIVSSSIIQEIVVAGDFAYCWSYLTVAITLGEETPKYRAGHALTILRKNPDGAWVIARDANMLTG